MNCIKFWQGMGVGLAIGAGLCMVIKPKKSSMSKTTGKILKKMGCIIEGVSNTLGI